jgi:hypothetical protein
MIGSIHIVPRGDLWGVVREGDDGDITSYMPHDDAVRIAREIAEQEHAELVLHEPVTWSLPETAGDWWSG